MPPKPAPKLTKQQLKALALQEAKKKQQEQLKRQQQQQEKRIQQQRLNQIEMQKFADEERRRISVEKQQYSAVLKQRIKNQEKVLQDLLQEHQWNNTTTEYYKNYDVKGANLSTFINTFRDAQFKKPQKSLEFCQQAQIIISKIKQLMLNYRADSQTIKQQGCINAIREIHKIELQKLEEIMIWMANQAEDMEEKNNELTRNKGEPNRRVEGRKLLQYIQQLTKNFKIGMFLNSTTTKTVNKFRPIQIKQFGLNTEIPSKWINANTIVKFEWVNFDPFQTQHKQIFHIIGGVYNLEFYELLIGSKRINNVVLKKHYKGKQILEKFKLQTSLIKEPFQLQYQIPQQIFLKPFTQTSLQFAQYDFSTNKWSILPNDTVQQYHPDQKKVILKVSRPQPIAYIQERCCDYPYVGWQLRTVDDQKVMMDIQLKRIISKKKMGDQDKFDIDRLIVTFEINEDLIKLSLNQSYPEFSDLCEKYLTPQYLLSELSNRGIHLLPDDFDYQQSKIPKKSIQTEKNAIRDIAYAVQSFYIRSQPNDSSEIVIKIRQNLDHQSIFLEDQQKDWKIIHWKENTCWVSNRNIREKHLNLQVLLQKHNITLNQCLERIKYDKKYLLRKTVIKMLSLTKILSFTTSKYQESKLKEILKTKILVK